MPAYGSAPAAYVVYQDQKPKKSKFGKPYTARMGGYNTLDEAKAAIVKNEREMLRPNSYGGLIDWGDDTWKRHYRIFKATYTEVV